MTKEKFTVNEVAVKLIDCPPGPFMHDGYLGFRTEYGGMDGDPLDIEAYVMASGEYFWGGTDNKKDRSQLMVHPCVLENDISGDILGYMESLADLHVLGAHGNNDSDEADAVRDRMDGPWMAIDKSKSVVVRVDAIMARMNQLQDIHEKRLKDVLRCVALFGRMEMLIAEGRTESQEYIDICEEMHDLQFNMPKEIVDVFSKLAADLNMVHDFHRIKYE